MARPIPCPAPVTTPDLLSSKPILILLEDGCCTVAVVAAQGQQDHGDHHDPGHQAGPQPLEHGVVVRLHLVDAEVTEADRQGPGGGTESEQEDIEITEMSIDELRARLDAGELVDAKTIIAAQWLLSRYGPSNHS